MKRVIVAAPILFAVGVLTVSAGNEKDGADDLRKEIRSLRRDVDHVLDGEKYDKEEIGYLEELVKALEATSNMIRSKLRTGGVKRFDWPAAQYQVFVAKGRLAWARGQFNECLKQYESAVSAAEQNANLLDALFRAGVGSDSDSLFRGSADSLLRAQIQLTEAKLNLSRMKKKVARIRDG